MDRRSFLTGTGTLALSQILAGCGGQNQETLSLKFLKGSVPNSVVKAFRAAIRKTAKLDFTSVTQLSTLFENLQSWQQKDEKIEKERWCLPIRLPFLCESNQPPDLLTIGDYWLAAAIEQNLIQPLVDATEVPQLSNLYPQWQKLNPLLPWDKVVRRDKRGFPDPQGQIWAAPYRWGYTVIAYNVDKFESLNLKKPSDWGDLWREELRDRISLPNHPREVIGLTLKTLEKRYNLEKCYNLENLGQAPNLTDKLLRLHQQVKLYSSDTYIEPLILGDTWLAVGWSNDLLPIMQRYRHIDVVIPSSGTALWADLWVRPAGKTANQALDQLWINYCWETNIAEQITLLSKANSPIPVTLNPTSIQEGLRPLLIPNEQIVQSSEFLLPLSPEVQQQYQSLWEKTVTSSA